MLSVSECNKNTQENIHDKLEFCPTRLIDDIPADSDLLAFHEDIGPHARVAKTIAELIQSPDESGGKMIGLEGGWGAGKSTVINLVCKHLEGNQDIAVFSFDAWAHEGDPLRRTFLESIIRHFQSIEWIDHQEWDEIIEKLAKRRKVTNIRTVPKPTILGKRFAVSLIFVPVGSQLLSTSLREGIIIDFTASISWMFIVGVLFSFAPIFVLLWNWIDIALKNESTSV